MVYRSRRGSDWGAFAKGFSDAFAAMLKLNEDRRHNEALEAHWKRLEDIAGAKDPFYNGTFAGGKAGFREGVGQPIRGEDPEMRDHIIQWSQEHGKNPAEALAIWRQESSGGTNMVGDGQSSFGDFQFHFGGINPAMPHPGMGDDFKAATGIDMRTAYTDKEARFKAADFALERAASKGWGDWANSVKATGVPMRWSDAGKTETAKAEPTVDGKPAVTPVDVSGKEKAPEAKSPEAKTASLMGMMPGGEEPGPDVDEELRQGAEHYRALPEGRIEDRRKFDPTSGGEVDLGIRGRDVELDAKGRPTAYVSPEGRAWAASHMPASLPDVSPDANQSGAIPGGPVNLFEFHPGNILQSHPPGSATLGPVFPGPATGS